MVFAEFCLFSGYLSVFFLGGTLQSFLRVFFPVAIRPSSRMVYVCLGKELPNLLQPTLAPYVTWMFFLAISMVVFTKSRGIFDELFLFFCFFLKQIKTRMKLFPATISTTLGGSGVCGLDPCTALGLENSVRDMFVYGLISSFFDLALDLPFFLPKKRVFRGSM